MVYLLPDKALWFLYVGGYSNKQLLRNFRLGLTNGVWGVEKRVALDPRFGAISPGDQLILVCGYRRSTTGPNQNRYRSTEDLKKHFLQFNTIAFTRITSTVFRDESPIWDDGTYPYRITFDVLSVLENFSLNQIIETFGEANLEVFRLGMVPPVKIRQLEHNSTLHQPKFVRDESGNIDQDIANDLENFLLEEERFEGSKNLRLSNYYERDAKLRERAIAIHGIECKVCGFSFEQFYGEVGNNFIEVHHLVPISKLGESTLVDPNADMTVVCSNCHRMIHRNRDKPLSLEELRSKLRLG